MLGGLACGDVRISMSSVTETRLLIARGPGSAVPSTTITMICVGS